MLTKLSTFILGLLDNQAMNPYEIKKILNKSETELWFPMNTSSVYTNIKRLEKKDYINGKIKKEGSKPEKTIYEINKSGKNEFKNSLKDGLESFELEVSDFSISMYYISNLDKISVIDSLNKRLKNLEIYEQKMLDFLKNNNQHPSNLKILIRTNLYRILTEIEITKKLIEDLKK